MPSRPQWKELGIESTIKQQEFQQYLEFLGPPPNDDVDVFRLGWIGDFVDAINFLELWTCESGNNNTNFCNEEYDAKIEEARTTVDNDARFELYGEAEEIMFGENGDMPVIPIYFYTYTNLEKESVQGQLQPEPARPGRPDRGRRHRVTPLVRTGVGLTPRPRSGILNVGRD